MHTCTCTRAPTHILHTETRTQTQTQTDMALLNLRNCLNHIYAHLDTALGMVGPGFGHAAYTVVTIAQDLDAEAMVLGSELVEAGKQLVEHLDELIGRAQRWQGSEATDVSKQDTESERRYVDKPERESERKRIFVTITKKVYNEYEATASMAYTESERRILQRKVNIWPWKVTKHYIYIYIYIYYIYIYIYIYYIYIYIYIY